MTTAHKSCVLDMTRGDPFRLLLQFSLPLFCSNLLQQVYNLTDTALAGHLLGSAALAEIGATAALYGLIMNFAFGMNNGLALTVSRCFGAGEREGIRRAVGWMVTLSAAVSIVLTTVSLLGRGALLQVLQVPAEVWDGAAAYLTVILLGIPLTMLYNMEAALLRAVGNSVTPLLFLLFSSVLNVGLDAAFMGPLGMGVRGAAVATVLAQGISAVLGAVYLVRSYPELHFAPAHLKKSARRAVMNMFWAGMSMGLMSAIYNLGSVALQSSINALGSVYITAQTAARRMAEMYFIPGGALGIGVATFSSQNLGAGRRSRIGQIVRAALKIYFVWWLFVLAFTFLLGEPVLRLITGSSDVRIISNAMLYLKISVPIIPPMAVLVILRNMLQGIRHTVEPLLASALELIGKVIFAVWLVPVWGYRAVCFCEPTTWVICFVFILLAVWHCRSDLQDACPPDKTPA
ncbi:MATE family efflux transporter [Gemmiger sp.]|jgi:putative MATE family efflux protein|uniref:MATE family efflux transporter n=1 Tax=Gemmiger sp. TaxID=2049027 RepID=UPI003A91A2C2